MSMQPLPKALIDTLAGQFPALYSQEHTPDPLVLAHFFSPANGWEWYLWEGSPVDSDGYYDTQQPKVDFLCFGLVCGFEDEVGYVSLEPAAASLLFQLIAKRYEKHQPLILTSNKAFGEWGQVFGGDAVLASAALDRLLHRATVLHIRGESYRLRERRQAGVATPPSPVPASPGQA